MAGRDELHDLRQRAQEAGVQGCSTMSEEQLREALEKIGKRAEPMITQWEAKGYL